MKRLLPATFALCALSPLLHAQSPSSTGDPTLDKQRDIILGRSAFDSSLDKNNDSQIDVRDMALHVIVNGRPAEASFASEFSRAFPSQGSVQVPIFFSKPVSGVLRLELSGTAVEGADYTASSIGRDTPDPGLSRIVREITLPANSTSHAITVPLAPTTGEFRGERRLVLTLRADATYNSSNNQVTRDGPAPGAISSHTIVISEAEHLWTGTLDFSPPEATGAAALPNGFGTIPATFALDANGSLRASLRGSKFFADAAATQGAVGASGALVFAAPLTGRFQPSFGRADAAGNPVPSGPAASWSLTFDPAAIDPAAPGLFDYPVRLQVSDFPAPELHRTYSAVLTLSPSR